VAEDVYAVYEGLLKQGKTAKDAAKEAQARTGVALRSGRPINRSVSFTSKGISYGSRYLGLYSSTK